MDVYRRGRKDFLEVISESGDIEEGSGLRAAMTGGNWADRPSLVAMKKVCGNGLARTKLLKRDRATHSE